MKILNLKIFNPNDELIRNIDFQPSGASVIYGKVEEPTKKTKTNNSIGKTLLLRFISYILGKKEKKTDYSQKIIGWKLEAIVLYKNKKHTVQRTLGDSKSIRINKEKYTYAEYLEFFAIGAGLNSKQIFLSRRQNMISDVNPRPTKDEVKNTLILLQMDNIIELFNNMRSLQEKANSIKEFSNQFKDDLKILNQEEFRLEQEKNKKEEELKALSNRIETLQISEDSIDLMDIHSHKKIELKSLKSKIDENEIKISRLNDLIREIEKSDISSNDVMKIYEMASVQVPDMVIKAVSDVQKFYDEMFKDKVSIYESDIKKLQRLNEELSPKIFELSKVVDNLASKISDNNIFKEAMNLYQLKNNELLDIQSSYSKIVGSISNLNKRKAIQNEISQKYIILEDEMRQYDRKVDEYRRYILNLVNSVYGEENFAYFDISVSNSQRKVESMPISFDLTLEGDFGEGVKAVKNILIDLLLFNYNDYIEFLVHDSSCFEGIDKRQLSTLISVIHNTALKIDKQYIFSINEYHISKDDIELSEIIDKFTSIPLTENDTLLKFRF